MTEEEIESLKADNSSLRGSCKALGDENKHLKRKLKRLEREFAALKDQQPAYGHIDQFGELASSAISFSIPPTQVQPADELVEVVAWRIGNPAKQWKVYEKKQNWAYQQYGNIKYEVQDLMTVAQHQRILSAELANVHAALAMHDRIEKDTHDQCVMLREALKGLLSTLPSVTCDSFHHPRKDHHLHSEECPVLARYLAAVERSRAVLAAHRAQNNQTQEPTT